MSSYSQIAISVKYNGCLVLVDTRTHTQRRSRPRALRTRLRIILRLLGLKSVLPAHAFKALLQVSLSLVPQMLPLGLALVILAHLLNLLVQQALGVILLLLRGRSWSRLLPNVVVLGRLAETVQTLPRSEFPWTHRLVKLARYPLGLTLFWGLQ